MRSTRLWSATTPSPPPVPHLIRNNPRRYVGKRPTVPGFHFWKAVLMRRISYHSRRSARMPDAHKRGFLLSPPLLGKNREKLRRFACICAFSSVFFYCTLLHDLGSLLPVPPHSAGILFLCNFLRGFNIQPARSAGQRFRSGTPDPF